MRQSRSERSTLSYRLIRATVSLFSRLGGKPHGAHVRLEASRLPTRRDHLGARTPTRSISDEFWFFLPHVPFDATGQLSWILKP